MRRLAPLAVVLIASCTAEPLLDLFAEDCAASAGCAAKGACARSYYRAGDGLSRCYVARVEDCRASAECASEGRCAFDPAVSLECVHPSRLASPPPGGPCAADLVCRDLGMCGVFEGTCAATDAKSCAASLGCVLHGRCSLIAETRMCGAASDVDCALSYECLAFGRCARPTYPLLGTAIACAGKDGVMPAYGDLRCTRTEECAIEGRCLRADDGRCLTPEEVGLSGERLREALSRFETWRFFR